MAVTHKDLVERMKDTDKVRQTLEDTKACFNTYLPNAKWFVHCGTALAVYYGRNKPGGATILPGDHDMDMGILAETCPEQKFIEAFDKAGFVRGGFFHDPEIPAIGVVLRYLKYGIPIDFCFMYLRNRKRWWLTSPRNVHVQAAYVFEDLHSAKLVGVEVPAPYPLEAYCCQRWKKIGDRFPEVPYRGEMIDRYPEWLIYDDQKEVK